MPLGIVSDEEFEKEIANARHVDIKRGRGEAKETPEIIREIIAEEAIVGNNTQKQIANDFGVSPSSVAAYKNGATSTTTYHEPQEKLQKKNDSVRNLIVGTARSRLLEALSHITADKLKDAKVRDVASVAKDMSAIINNVEPNISNTQIGAQFVFHVPKAREEKEFDIIDVTQ